jgi:hypothetical protein
LERFIRRIKISLLFGLISKTNVFIDEIRDFAEDFVIKASAWQLGGDPGKIDQLTSELSSLTCRGSNPTNCLTTIQNLLAYVTNKNGFAAQLSYDGLTPQQILSRFAITDTHYASYAGSGFDGWPKTDYLTQQTQLSPDWQELLDRLLRLYQTKALYETDRQFQEPSEGRYSTRLNQLSQLIADYEYIFNQCYQLGSQEPCHEFKQAPALPKFIID